MTNNGGKTAGITTTCDGKKTGPTGCEIAVGTDTNAVTQSDKVQLTITINADNTYTIEGKNTSDTACKTYTYTSNSGTISAN